MKEIITLRNKHTKHFDMGNNNLQCICGYYPLHYQDENNQWHDINMSLIDGQINTAHYTVKLLDGKLGYKAIDPNGKHIELELLDCKYSHPIIYNNIVTYQNVSPDVDLIFTFTPPKITVERILKTSKANKIAKFRSYRELGAIGKLLNIGQDFKGRQTKLTCKEQPGSKAGEKIIYQQFDNQVMILDTSTRKRQWSDDVKYPVIIDPTSTFTVTNAADDGEGGGFDSPIGGNDGELPWDSTNIDTNDATLGVNFWKKTIGTPLGARSGAYLRFSVSGISQSTTITSATIDVDGKNLYGSFAMKIQAKDSSDPANPTIGAHITAPTGVATNTAQTTWTNTSFASKSIVVTDIVQELVNSYSYSTSKHMLFLLNRPTQETGVTFFGYPEANNIKASEGSPDPKLVIDYVGGGGGPADNATLFGANF